MPNYRIWPSAAEPSRARPAGASRAPRRARFNAGQSGGPSPRRCPGKSGKERTLLRPFLEFEKEKARSFRSWPGILAPRVGFEPTTLRLTAECSAVELPRNKTALHRASGYYTEVVHLCKHFFPTTSKRFNTPCALLRELPQV